MLTMLVTTLAASTHAASFGAGGPDPVDVAFFQQPPPRTFARICVGGRNPIRSGLPPGAVETTGAIAENGSLRGHHVCGRGARSLRQSIEQ